MPTIKSRFKFTKNKRLSVSSYKYLAKAFDTLVNTVYMLLCATEHLHPTFLAIYFRTCCENVFIFFPLP